MDGTTEAAREAKRHEPSPLVAEVEGRLRAICKDGAEPWNDPAEVRRETRWRDMEIMWLSAMEAALHTTEYICGRLPGWKREPFEKITDPVASLANLNRAIVQITLAEDRFDESAEERVARIKAEAEAKVRAEQAAATAHSDAERTLRRAENKRNVQNAVRAITLDYLRLPSYGDWQEICADLFRELEVDGDYDADPAETVADVCLRLSLAPRILPGIELKTPDGKIDVVARKAHLRAFARTYLDLMKPAATADESDLADPSAPPAQAQGPPH
jgi:broad specificity phosphatase PhoE